MPFYDGGIMAPGGGGNQDANPGPNPTRHVTAITSQAPLEPACTLLADTFCPCHIPPPAPSLGEINARASVARIQQSHS